jgi:hypothetical protein
MADGKEKQKKAVKRIRKAVRKAVSKGVTELQISRTVDATLKPKKKAK